MRMAKNEFCNDKGIKTFSQDTSYGVQFVFRSLLFYQWISAILHRSGNRPFLSSPGPLFPYTRLSVQPLIWKWFFILMQIKLIFTRKVVHFASFWKRGFSELGSGLLSEPKLFVRKISLAALFVTISQTLTNFFQKRFYIYNFVARAATGSRNHALIINLSIALVSTVA